MNKYPRITIDPAVKGGIPCIAGTRLTVASVIAAWLIDDADLKRLCDENGLTNEDLEQARGYAIDYLQATNLRITKL